MVADLLEALPDAIAETQARRGMRDPDPAAGGQPAADAALAGGLGAGHGDHAVEAAILALPLAVERRPVARDAAVRADGGNIARAGPVRRLSKPTLGIVGHGRIGRTFLRRAAGEVARVLAGEPPRRWVRAPPTFPFSETRE